MLSKIKAIVFDFDGVIVDSVPIKTEAFQELYRSYGEEVVNKVREHHIKNGGLPRSVKFKIYHNEFLGMELTQSGIQDLSDKFSDLVTRQIIEADCVKGFIEFSNNYSDRYDFYVSTATPIKEILKIIEGKGIENLFQKIYGYPPSKDEHIESILSRHNKNEVLFVGDSQSDKTVAEKYDITFVACTVSVNGIFISSKYMITNFIDFNLIIKEVENERVKNS